MPCKPISQFSTVSLTTTLEREIKAVSQHAVESLENLLDKYGDLFAEELAIISHSVQNCMSDKHKLYKLQTVPYALETAINDELDHLEREGILEYVIHSE